MSLPVEFLIVVVPAALLVTAALTGLLAMLARVGGGLSRLARILLIVGGTLWILSLLAKFVAPATATAGGVGRLHLWFSGLTVILALLTIVGPRLARRGTRVDGRFETIGYVLTGMLAVIAVFYAHAAVFASGFNASQQVKPTATVSESVTCGVPEDRHDELVTPVLCSAEPLISRGE